MTIILMRRLSIATAWLAVWLLSGQTLAAQSAGDRTRIPLDRISSVDRAPRDTRRPLEADIEVQSAVREAQDSFDDGRYVEAIRRLEPIAADAGADVFEVQKLLAKSLARAALFADARNAAQLAERLNPDDLELQFLLGSLELERGQNEDAIPHLRAATEVSGPLMPLDATLSWYYLARALSDAGYLLAAEQALARFDKICFDTHPQQRNSRELRTLLADKPHGALEQRVGLLERLGDSDARAALTERALRRWPDSALVAQLHINSLLASGAATPAYDLARRWLDHADGGASFAGLVVKAAEASNRTPQLVDELAAAMDSGRGGIGAAVARRLIEEKRYADAVRLAEALRGARPDDLGATLLLASARRGMKDLRGAIQAVVEHIRAFPQAADGLLESLAQWGRAPDFAAEVLQIIQLERAPGDYANDFVLGVLAAVIQQPALADKLLSSSVAAQPEFTPAYVARGELLLASHDWKAAKAFAQQVLETRPDLPAAHLLLAQAHDGLDENADAENAYREAIRIAPASARAPLALARHYRRLGQLGGAERYFQDAFSKDPTNGEALEGLIDSYVIGRKIELARSQFESANLARVDPDAVRRCRTLLRFAERPYTEEHLAELQTQAAANPADIVTGVWLASALFENRRTDEAFAVLQRICDLAPDHVAAGLQLAQLHALRSELEPAIQRMEHLRRIHPNRVAILQPLSQLLLYDFRVSEARDALNRLIEIDTSDTLGYRARVLDTYEPFGEYEPALKLVDQWLKDEPTSELLLAWRENLLLALERNDEALAESRRRLDEMPEDEQRRERYIEVALLARAYDELIPRLRDWLAADPGSAEYANALIGALNLAARSSEAAEVARAFEGEPPPHLLRRVWLAQCMEAEGNLDGAIAEYEGMLRERLTPDRRTQAHFQLHAALVQARRFDAALTHADAWLAESRDTRDPTALLAALRARGQALQALGDEPGYIETLQLIYDLRPSDVGLNNDLGYTWVDRGENIAQATGMIRYAFADEPLNAAYLDSLGWAYYKAGDFSAAHKYLSRCPRLRAGRDAVIYDHIADAAWRLGDREDALANWKKALEAVDAMPPEQRQARDTRLVASIRMKLKAAEENNEPAVAPTAAEQRERTAP